jgi:hypothetical protein
MQKIWTMKSLSKLPAMLPNTERSLGVHPTDPDTLAQLRRGFINLDDYDFITWLRKEIINFDTPGSHTNEFDRVITDENGKEYAVYCDTEFSIYDFILKSWHSEVCDWEYINNKLYQIHSVKIEVIDFDNNEIKWELSNIDQLTKPF